MNPLPPKQPTKQEGLNAENEQHSSIKKNELDPSLEKTSNQPQPLVKNQGKLPIDLSAPHASDLKNLTLESIQEAEERFSEGPSQPLTEPQGFWSKAKASLWGAVCYCTGYAESKFSSGEVQQTSKIVSAGRKFQLGISTVLDSQNMFDLTRGNKTHLDYTLSVLSAAAGFYKFIAKHNKGDTKCAKALSRIDKAREKLESLYEKAEKLQTARDNRLSQIEEKMPVLVLQGYKQLVAEKRNLEQKIKALQSEIKQCDNEIDVKAKKEELDQLRHEHAQIQKNINSCIESIDQELPPPSLIEIEAELLSVNESLTRLDHDIRQLAHESYELSKQQCTTSALLLVSGSKTVVSTAKYATDYASDYHLTMRQYNKAIKGYLASYMMVPIFVTGLSVSLYGSYSLGQNYVNRTRIQAAAQSSLSNKIEDAELEAFTSLVASRQRTTQAALSLGSTVAKVTQNALALGIAFGGISLASAATGISEEVLEMVVTPATWLIGGAVACTSLGLKTYQNYKEACRQEEEAHWVQVLRTSTENLRDEKLSLSEQKDAQASKNEAILRLMELNVDFSVGVILARLDSMNAETRESTGLALKKLGLEDADLENIRELSPQLACNFIKEKLCLM